MWPGELTGLIPAPASLDYPCIALTSLHGIDDYFVVFNFSVDMFAL
jgi:hypothetical protein